MIGLVMRPQWVSTEVAVEVTPHRVDVVGVILGVIEFDQERRRLNPVIMQVARSVVQSGSPWSPFPHCSCRADVNLQLSDRTAQRIAVYAEFPGCLALISSLILEHSKDERLLKRPYRFRASHTGFINLQDNTL